MRNKTLNISSIYPSQSDFCFLLKSSISDNVSESVAVFCNFRVRILVSMFLVEYPCLYIASVNEEFFKVYSSDICYLRASILEFLEYSRLYNASLNEECVKVYRIYSIHYSDICYFRV